jgi:cysteine desulfurase / selenocysteine lyase
MVDWNEIRNAFPVCSKYIYLNPAGGSPMSIAAAKEGQRFYDDMLEWGDLHYDDWIAQTELVRQKTAAYIGAGKREIAFVPNTSTGMSYIANMLKGMGEILTTLDEFPSTTLPWLNLGQHITYIQPEKYSYNIDIIEKHINPKTRILISSYVQYSTGFRQDLTALGNLCRSKGLIFIVNATQALPIFPVDVKKDQIDFLVFTGLKWAGSGYGSGVLFVAAKWLETLTFPVAGWRSVERPELMDNTSSVMRNEASALEGGCPPFPNVFALGGAIDFFNNIGPERLSQRVLYLSEYLDKKLRKMGLDIFSPSDDRHRSGIVMIRTGNAKDIAARLLEKKIFVSARGQGLRVSVSIFNNEVDLETFISELEKIRGLI